MSRKAKDDLTGAVQAQGTNGRAPSLQEILGAVSRTFAHTLAFLPSGIREWLTAAYLEDRVIDEIEDNPGVHQNYKDMMLRIPSVLRRGDESEVATLSTFLKGLTPTKPEYRILLDNLPVVHSALRSFPECAQNTIEEYGIEMAIGLSSLKIREIRTLEDHHEYCHFAAGVVGFMITELMRSAGHFKDEDLRILMPRPEIRRIGANPAHDFGVGLQLVNDIRDLHEDYVAGGSKWPSELIEAEGLTVEDLINLKADGENVERAYRVLQVQLGDAKDYIMQAKTWIDRLPFEQGGVRRCWINTAALAAATCRAINTPAFYYDSGSRKITRGEVLEIDKKVVGTIQRNESPSALIGHLFEKPANEYESPKEE
ncbi:MAG: squalene/phytoene synthase family protein [Nanoarchaeota archaeon]|nr:squalene/phytoene synthase family protein [Nanoarchaeota archaeon]MBU1103104.1 squalene/phytoene synthase family protein [Nanoarchaeota archaeon]